MTRAAIIAVIVGGLVLGSAAAATWVRRTETRSVGDVEVAEQEVVAGGELAPNALPAGALAAVVGLALFIPSRRVRRLAAAMALVLGLVGLAAVGTALPGAAAGSGEQLTAAPVLALAGGLLVALPAALLLVRPVAPAGLGTRYTVEQAEDDDEWRIAADDGDS